MRADRLAVTALACARPPRRRPGPRFLIGLFKIAKAALLVAGALERLRVDYEQTRDAPGAVTSGCPRPSQRQYDGRSRLM